MRKLLLLFFITLIICVACNTNGSSLVCGENKSNISLYVINPSEQIVIINMDANKWQAYFKGGGDTTCIFII